MSLGVKEVYLKGFSRLDFKENPRMLEVLSVAEKLFPNRNAIRILDVGCGDGNFTHALAEKVGGKELFGIDIAPEAVRLANENNVEASVLDVDQDNLPYDANSFDLVYCGNLIELVLDPDHLLQELQRVLKPSGVLILTFPNLAAWASRISVFLGYHPFYDRISRRYNIGKIFVPATRGDSTGFIRLFTTKSFKQLVELYGFKLDSYFGTADKSLPSVMHPFDKFFAKFPSLAFQVISVSRKKGS